MVSEGRKKRGDIEEVERAVIGQIRWTLDGTVEIDQVRGSRVWTPPKIIVAIGADDRVIIGDPDAVSEEVAAFLVGRDDFGIE